MTDPKPILWMRRKTLENKELFHVHRSNYPTQDTHYFYTLCHKEIKGLYGMWDIVENPPIDQCCPECLAFIKSGEPPWW